MKTSALERTYVSIADAQRTADTFNAFVEWIKNVEGFHPVRELRPMYFGEDAPSYLFNSHTSQVAHWMHKLWEADLVEVEFHFEEKTFTTCGYHWESENGQPEKIEVTDAQGNKYMMRNPNGEYVYGEFTKTVKNEIMYYRYKG